MVIPRCFTLMASVAVIALLTVACMGTSSKPTPSSEQAIPPPSRIVMSVTPVTSETPEMLADFLLVKQGGMLTCSNEPGVNLPSRGEAFGFAGRVTIERRGHTTQINWDEAGARSLIVNDQLWTPINTGGAPPLATVLKDADWNGFVASLKGCS